MQHFMYHLSLLEMPESISKHFFKTPGKPNKTCQLAALVYSELHPRETQRLPAVSFLAPEISYSSLSMDKKIINRSLHYAISSLCTFLPLSLELKQTNRKILPCFHLDQISNITTYGRRPGV